VLSLAATRATLAEVLTDEAFERMIALGERFEAGVAETIERHGLPWHVTRLGCRVEYLFRPDRPRSRQRGRGRRQRTARPADPPLRAESRHPADAVPQHGPHVA
jgi:glutamate-1-semialdehyde aminotransferase